MGTNQLPQEQGSNPLWSQLYYPDFPSKFAGCPAGPRYVRLNPAKSPRWHDADGSHPRPEAHVTGILLDGNFCSFHPNLLPQGPTIPFFQAGKMVICWSGPIPPPAIPMQTRLEQQLIFQEGLFLKLLQNRPTHQGLHSVLSGDCQGETWPSCCLKTEPFCFTWQETGGNEDSAATATRGKLMLF